MIEIQHVQYLATKREIRDVFLPDQYQLRPSQGYVWLQKAAIWVLKKLKCYAVKKEAIFSKITIDPYKLMEKLLAENANLAMEYNLRGERVLMGYEDFSRLNGENIHFSSPISFEAPYLMSSSGDYDKWESVVCGMKITVIPWMRGILILPKDAW